MTIGIDMGALLKEQLNDMVNKKLLESTEDERLDSASGKLARGLIELCNKHNMYGFEAIEFVTELLGVLDKASREGRDNK